ncbi:MAG: hypothetical protein ABJE95_15820 [Byssovorax sp.]
MQKRIRLKTTVVGAGSLCVAYISIYRGAPLRRFATSQPCLGNMDMLDKPGRPAKHGCDLDPESPAATVARLRDDALAPAKID